MGKGIQITGATFPANGFDAYSASPTVKTWSNNAYTGITGTNIPIATDKGYMTFIRGDRTINYFTTTLSPATVLRTSGTLKTGKYPAASIPLAAGEFTSVGNPYASAIDFNKLTRTGGTPNTFYVWDPKLTTGAGTAYGLGGFRTITWDAANSNYIVTPAGGSYTGGNTAIESGEAFFVVAPLSNGTLSFNEAAKEVTSNLVTRNTTLAKQLRTNLYVISAGNAVLIDGALVQYDAAYTNDIDELDAVKINNTGENAGIRRNNKIYAVERRAEIASTDTIFYNLGQVRVQQYKLELIADNLSAPGLEAFIEDSYLNTRTTVSLTDTTFMMFSVNSSAGSYAADRFRIVFSRPMGPLPVTITRVSANRNRDKTINVSWKVENELSMDSYEVQRSADGRSFTKISATNATTNNGGSTSYDRDDTSPLTADNFYRIKAISLSGQVQYSAVVKVAAQNMQAAIVAYPNPVLDKKMAISFISQPAGEYNFKLCNQIGQTLLSNKILVEGNNFVESLSLPQSIAAGIYQLTITSADGIKTTQQIVIQ